MIHIKKQTEPQSLLQFKRLGGRYFDDLDRDTKDELRKSLLTEQGYICAYCMSRISDEKNSKIEHYIPRNEDNQVDYENLLIVCKGGEGQSEKQQTCDTKKGNLVISIDPQNKHHIDTIEYSSLGKIISSNTHYDREINEVLNLNDELGYLLANRFKALNAVKNYLSKFDGHIRGQKIKKLYAMYSTKDERGYLMTYVGIIMWYLSKRLK